MERGLALEPGDLSSVPKYGSFGKALPLSEPQLPHLSNGQDAIYTIALL